MSLRLSLVQSQQRGFEDRSDMCQSPEYRRIMTSSTSVEPAFAVVAITKFLVSDWLSDSGVLNKMKGVSLLSWLL